MTLGNTPIDGIDHIVVLMLENRSYDNIFGRLDTDAEPADRTTADPQHGGFRRQLQDQAW